MNANDYFLKYKRFMKDVLGDKLYYHIPNEFLLGLNGTLEGIFQEISSSDAIKETADMFHIQPEQVTPEMRRLAREIRGLRNSR